MNNLIELYKEKILALEEMNGCYKQRVENLESQIAILERQANLYQRIIDISDDTEMKEEQKREDLLNFLLKIQ